jgi:hypothetical protein
MQPGLVIFPASVDGQAEGGISSIALNAPETKGSFALAYRDARAGFNAEARLRMTAGLLGVVL